MTLFRSQAKQPPSVPPPLPSGVDGRRLRAIGVPPGQSAADAVQDIEGAAVHPMPPKEEAVEASLPDGNPDESLKDPLQRALQSVRDGAPSVVAVTFLDGDRWRHVVSTNDFPHREHQTALSEWEALLRNCGESL